MARTHEQYTWVTTDGSIAKQNSGNWRAECQDWIHQMVAAFSVSARARSGNLFLVGMSCGAWWTAQLLGKAGPSTRVRRALTVGPYWRGPELDAQEGARKVLHSTARQ